MSPDRADLLTRVRRICAQLPDTEESSRLGGQPHFYVNGKIYTGCGVEDGVWSAGMKVGLELQSLLVTRPGFRVAKYVGRYGWINVDESALADDAELERLIRLSYDLIRGDAAGAPAAAAKPSTRAGAKAGSRAQPGARRESAPEPEPSAANAKSTTKATNATTKTSATTKTKAATTTKAAMTKTTKARARTKPTANATKAVPARKPASKPASARSRSRRAPRG